VIIWAAISWYSARPIITLNGRIIASDYANILSNQVCPMDQMLFPNNYAIFQDDTSPTHTARSVQSCLRSMKMHFNIFPDQHNRQT
jgi:hypothetical protein